MRSLCLLAALFIAPLNAEVKVLAFSGSARADSLNQKLVQEAAEIARQKGATVKVISLADYPMPLYNADLEAKEGMPESAKRFRRELMSYDRFLIASPEYNGLLTALLKNAIDWGTRDEQANYNVEAFRGKKFAIMSASPGPGGGSRSLQSLSELIRNVGGQVVSLTVSIPAAHNAFDAQNQLINTEQKRQLNQVVSQLLQ